MVTQTNEEELNELIIRHLKLKEKIVELEDLDKVVKTEVKIILKRMNINFYKDLKGNQITYKPQSRESLDKIKVKSYLSDEQYAEVIKISSFEVLKILSKNSLAKMKKFINGDKNA